MVSSLWWALETQQRKGYGHGPPEMAQTGLQREVATEKALWLRVEGKNEGFKQIALARLEAWPSQREDQHSWRQIAPRG